MEEKKEGIRQGFKVLLEREGPLRLSNNSWVGTYKLTQDEKLFLANELRKTAIKDGNERSKKFNEELMIRNVEAGGKGFETVVKNLEKYNSIDDLRKERQRIEAQEGNK